MNCRFYILHDRRGQVELKIRKTPDAIIIYLDGTLDLYNTASTGKGIHKLISAETESNIIINLQDVDYINSSGIGLFINTNAILKKEHRKLILCNMNKEIRRVLDMADILDLFDISDSEKEAVELIKK